MQETVAPRGPKRQTLVALGFAIIVVIALAVSVAARNTIAAAVAVSIARGLGYDVHFGSLDLGPTRLVATGVRIRSAAGEPVLDTPRIAIGFSLRDLLPGGKRLFGLTSIVVDAPHVTVIHHANGSYNITLPATAAGQTQAAPPPLDASVQVTRGTVDLIDRFVVAPREREERLTGVHIGGIISPASGSYYHAGATLEDAGHRYPIRGEGRFDDPAGFALQRWSAPVLPIAALANFALSSHAIVVAAGELRGLDVIVGAAAGAGEPLHTHLGVRARLVGARVAAVALAKPLRDVRATLVIDDDNATVRSLDANLNGIALHLSGAIYHLAAPQIAFALTARGDLAQARGLSRDSTALPISGALTIHALAEGSAASPVVFARIGAPQAAYSAYRFMGARGFVAIAGNELDVIAAALHYGPIRVAGRGSLRLSQHTQTTAYGTVDVPANSVPYVENVIPDLPLAGVASIAGTDAKLAARGYLGGVSGSNRLDVPFALAASGPGTLGPVVLQRTDGASIFARATIDRSTNDTVALLDVHRLSLLPAPSASLPGVALPALPPHLDAKLDATLTARATGTTLRTASGALHAYGSWGDLRADADGSTARLAARGRLTTSFAQLRPLGEGFASGGAISVPFAVTSAGRSTIVQIQHARFAGGKVRGISVDGADATIGLRSGAVDVYAADVRVDGRDVTAIGSFGNGGHVRLTAGDLDLAPARAAGLPLAGGHAAFIADVGGSYTRPTATLRAALGDARYAGTAVGGDIGVTYAGTTVQIKRATLNFGSAYATATGVVSNVGRASIAPRYDLHAALEDADIATLARSVKTPLRYPAGTLDADLHVGGSGGRPIVRGAIRLPEGSLNGLSFRAGRVDVDADASGVTARDGSVTVGTTTIAFDGSANRTEQRAHLRASRLDLTDFDDYFDEADVLAGTGYAALGVDRGPAAVGASANLALTDTRYLRYDLGTIRATVGTAGHTVRIAALVDGANGRLTGDGRIGLPTTDPSRDIVRRSALDVQAQIAGIDLGNVLPAAGIAVPLVGIVDASLAVRGRYPALAVSARAALSKGLVGRVPIDHFTLAASAANGRGRLTDLSVDVPGLSARGSGSFGLRPADKFNVRVDTASPDLNELIATVSGKSPGVTGSLATRALLGGTLAQPRLATTVDAANIVYHAVSVPAVHVELDATRQAADLRDGRITLTHNGALGLAGHVPLGGGFSMTSTPISFDVTPRHIDLAAYSALLPDGSVAAGIFDGNVGVRGTLTDPRLIGKLTLNAGSYRSKTLTGPLTAIALELDFSGTQAQLAKLHAHAAPGDIDGSGSLAVHDLRDPVRGLSANLNLSLTNAHIAAPKYFVGSVDGTLTARKAVGGPARIGGNLTFARARIPYTALLPGGGGAGGAAPSLPDVGFDLGVNLGSDVRVQSGPVDIGATGMATLGGTLAQPTLSGTFSSTDGTVSLYRSFTVQNGSSVTFTPSDGITPTVDATASTSIDDPPTDVLLRITGLSTHLSLAFSSQPAYSQQQILGLLVGAQALGAVSGVASSNGASAGGVSVAGLGEGVLNTQLTQSFLAPLTSKLGGAIGLSDLSVNYNTTGGVSAGAVRRLGKNISFTYGEQIGGTSPRTSLGVRIGNTVSSAQLTIYETTGSDAFGALAPFSLNNSLATSPPNYTLEAIEPPTGSGFVFSYQKHFW